MFDTHKWPKKIPVLTAEQQWISHDFMKYWHELLPKRYGVVEHFNHSYVVKHAPEGFQRTLEIGAGLGEHLQYEKLTDTQRHNYVALELRENMAMRIRQRYPDIIASVGDCQEKLDYSDGYFDRIVAIHVLEHLTNLPAAIEEMYRLCDRQRGVFSVVIPCEGSPAYSLARRISAQRVFEQRYKQPYRWFYEREHINRPAEIFHELSRYFSIIHRSFFPIPVPFLFCNLCIGLTLRPRPAIM
jgi:ubiquinone/menaquinone biosynthesis C-methylase UbiE